MNEKAFYTLEMPKVLDKLAQYTSFSGGEDLALTLAPTTNIEEAKAWIQETSEARNFLEEHPELFSLGGVHDVRHDAMSTTRGRILEPHVLLDIRSTLQRATLLRRTMGRLKNLYPILASITERLEESTALQHEIARIIGDDGIVQDSASTKLAFIRRDLRKAFERLQSKLNSIINGNNAKYLQEQLISQRNGRYVIPIKADFKGRIPGIIQDQSQSGATLWIEPLKTVEINNEYRELQLQEEKEIRRILTELCDLVASEAPYIARTVEVLSYIDLIFAKAHYANVMNANAPELLGFDAHPDNDYHPRSIIKLVQARHPLLIDSGKVVPTDMDFGDNTYGLVITGPNTGGKTVALKTAGLMVLMAQCGMHIPADEGTQLSVFENLYADIGDEQSIEQSLSTFSGHMTNIIDILQQATDRSLVILDELGAGTDPAEGSALARAILSRLLDEGITTLVTSHHPELKIYAQERRGVRNASVEFDVETLAPTYRLMVGLPGRSNALAIATRLGLPADIIDDAKSMVATEDLVADDLLDEITKTREETRAAYERAAETETHIEELREELKIARNELENERRDVMIEARRKAEYEINELRKEIKRLKKDLINARQPLDALKKVENLTDKLDLDIEVPDDPRTKDIDEKVRQLRLGDSVWVSALQTEGQVTEITEEEAEVAIGQMRVRAKLHELEFRKKGKKDQPKERSREKLPERGASPGLELDLRGSRTDDAIARAEQYVDSAWLAELPYVRIIHGKGTGALRNAIRQMLKSNSLVVKFSSGSAKEGGDGVTVVTLQKQY